MSNISPHPVLHLFADQGKIAQVVRNLLSNALKFTSRDGAVSVTLSVVEEVHTPDVEKGLPSGKWTRFLNMLSPPGRGSFLIRSPKTYSQAFLGSKYLLIDVKDTGVGISLVKMTHSIENIFHFDLSAYFSQEKQQDLFGGSVQFSPGVLQQGQGAGLGLHGIPY